MCCAAKCVQTHTGSALGATTHHRAAAPCFNLSDFAPTAAPAVAIAAGDEHSIAITRDGELFAWGKGAAALGVADGTHRDTDPLAQLGASHATQIRACQSPCRIALLLSPTGGSLRDCDVTVGLAARA